jgi:hypothetical protein
LLYKTQEGPAIKTLVYQSFRTENVPLWLSLCMDSVKHWTASRNYSYVFIDDSFFDYAPAWFHEATNSQRHLISDYARLELAAIYLNQEWDTVIWVDADVFICNINSFEIDNRYDFVLCRELWMTKRNGSVTFSDRINNSIMMFRKGNHFLSFYIDACKKIVMAKKQSCRHTEIGTNFLSGIPCKPPLLQTVACLSPFLLSAFACNRDDFISHYCNEFSEPIHAINLCLTFRDLQFENIKLTDQVYFSVIDYFKKTTRHN